MRAPGDGDPVAPPPTGTPRAVLRGLLRRPTVITAIGWLALIVVSSTLSSVLAPQDPLAQNLGEVLAGPSGRHWLGTDDLGRDLFSRLLHGGGYLLLVATLPMGIAYGVGVPFGLIAGWSGGRVDGVVNFVVNVIFAIPVLVIVLAVAAATGNNLMVLCLVFGLLASAGVVRLVRASAQAARGLLYVDAAWVAGLPVRRILARHILPNIVGPLIVQAFLLYSGTFIFLTSLSFLGLGFSPENPSWGQMIFTATQHINDNPWMMVPVGTVLIATVLSLNHLGTTLLVALPSAQRGSWLAPLRRESPPPPPPSSPTAVRSDAARPGAAAPSPAAPGPDALLAVDGLGVAYPGPAGPNQVVDGVSFTLRRQETLGLVGESGCGKTTTAYALLGLVPPPGRVTAGRILLDGQDLLRLDGRELGRLRGRRVALVPQEPMTALDPCFTVGSQLREPLRIHHRLGRRAAQTRALDLLRRVGIPRPDDIIRSHPHQLSGGMAQRVAIALALTGEPDVLIADEPTTALDVTVQAEILDLLRSLQAELGMALLLVTHDLGVVADLCDRVAVMRDGAVVETGSVEQVLLRPDHPYTRALLAASPELSPEASPR